MIRLVAIAVCGALVVPAAAFAADPAPAAAAAAAAPSTAQPVAKKDRKVCKTFEEKNSRLGSRQVCRTQAEWNDLSAATRNDIDRKLMWGGVQPST